MSRWFPWCAVWLAGFSGIWACGSDSERITINVRWCGASLLSTTTLEVFVDTGEGTPAAPQTFTYWSGESETVTLLNRRRARLVLRVANEGTELALYGAREYEGQTDIVCSEAGCVEGTQCGHIEDAGQPETFVDGDVPTRIPCLDPECGTIVEIAVGRKHSCAITRYASRTPEDEVWCWGANDDAQLGQPGGSAGQSGIPVRVPLERTYLAGAPSEHTFEVSRLLQIQAGRAHTCVLAQGRLDDKESTQQVLCWGSNAQGRIDPSLTANVIQEAHWVLTRDEVVGVKDVMSRATFTVGEDATCLVTGEESNLFCSGDHPLRFLDHAYRDGRCDCDGSMDYTCACLQDTCHNVPGENFRRTLSNEVDDVALGARHLTYLRAGWSDFRYRAYLDPQLEQVPYNQCNVIPGNLMYLAPRYTDGRVVFASGDHTCSIADVEGKDRLFCRGEWLNEGSFPDGTTTIALNSPQPFFVSEDWMQPIHYTAGNSHACVLMGEPFAERRHHLRCWGDNSKGQLGRDGTEGTPASPQCTWCAQNLACPPEGECNYETLQAKMVACGGDHCCAVHHQAPSTVLCWGYGGPSNLHLGRNDDSRAVGPVQQSTRE